MALRWLGLALASALLSAALLALHMPAAVLLGCMLVGLAFSVWGTPLAVPRRAFGWGQGLLGCLMAQSLHPDQLGQVAAHWPAVLGTTVLLLAASSGLGWWLMRRQIMPGTTAVWGMAPGAASAMVVMAEEYGADVRLVAFMQYTRVVAVTVVAALVARAAGAHLPVAVSGLDWLALGPPANLLLTAALVLGGSWLARRFDISGGAMVLPLVASVLVQLVWDVAPALPPALMALAYASIGWSVGLRFTRGVLLHALRALPRVLAAMALLMGVGLASGGVLVLAMGLDPLSAYLATSPGGADSMAVIAATSSVDTSFVMAMQLARFLLVLLSGPAISRWLAERGPAPS
jgi:membrane AbrB-like protein